MQADPQPGDAEGAGAGAADENLSAEGFECLRRYPVETQRILEDFDPAYARLGKIVVQVNERRDGSGYPQGLNRDEIHEIAQLVGLADTYWPWRTRASTGPAWSSTTR